MRYLLLFFLISTLQAVEKNTLIEKGQYLLSAGGCVACHTQQEGQYLAGGRAISSPFGTFYSSNITPDKTTGLGNWTADDFIKALRYGKNPQNHNYYPAFPYTSYTKMSKEDMLALWAYLQSVPAIKQENQKHELPWYVSRFAITFWKWFNFKPGEYQNNTEYSLEINRGAYLADALLHCTECHTPRNFMGGLKQKQYFQGSIVEESEVPDITQNKEKGIGSWSEEDLEFFFDIGMTPEGDFTGGLMAEVIDNGTGQLTEEDLKAMIQYLKTIQ